MFKGSRMFGIPSFGQLNFLASVDKGNGGQPGNSGHKGHTGHASHSDQGVKHVI